MVDDVRHLLVGCELVCGEARRGVGIAGAQVGPPDAFQPFLEGPGIERAQDVAAHAYGIFCHESQRCLEQPVGGCENVPEQPGIVVQRGCVLAIVAGQQADPVQGVEVAGTVRADTGSCGIRQASPPGWYLGQGAVSGAGRPVSRTTLRRSCRMRAQIAARPDICAFHNASAGGL